MSSGHPDPGDTSTRRGRHAAEHEVGARPHSTTEEFERAADIALAATPITRRLLDVGCGSGALLHELVLRVPYGEDFAGLDPDETMLAIAAQRPDERIRFVRGHAAALPFDDTSFDLAIALRSFHLWADQRRGLAELARVTRRGGRVVIIDRLADALAPGALRTGREFTAATERAGLRLIGEERVSRRKFVGTDLRAYVLEA